ncbi:hypothetical protein FRB99_006577 [Tulasnella sp. 403]|nr:hypothetical protein FRB99_006577 [Tulasnella sp. 403]
MVEEVLGEDCSISSSDAMDIDDSPTSLPGHNTLCKSDTEEEDHLYSPSLGLDVILLEFLGACNTDLGSLSLLELLCFALASLDDKDATEKGYAVHWEKAAKEEEKGLKISSDTIHTLRKHLRIMSSKVLGSDDARAANHSKIQLTSVFTGEDMDMDKFADVMGPDKHQQDSNIAHDPYATAKFYHFALDTLFKMLFQIDASGWESRAVWGCWAQSVLILGS